MELSYAKIVENNKYKFEFEERYPEDNVRKTTSLSVNKINPDISGYDSTVIESAEIQNYILSQVRDLCVYIADKDHREIFYKVADFIVKAQELPINIKTVNYPGSALILMEYGRIGITSESVKLLERSILDGFLTLSSKEEPLEDMDDEEEETSTAPPVEEEDFPFGVSNDTFVDDEFSLGQVEEVEEEKEDDND